MPEMKPVKSSNIESIGYDRDGLELHVRFKGGATYRYPEVDFKTFEAFQAAESHGRHFMEHIRPKYNGTKLPPPKKEKEK